MDVVGDELSALVQVAEGVAEEGEDGCDDLERDVPAAFDYLFVRCLLAFCPGVRILMPWKPTPNTMPVGNKMPKTNVCKKI